MKFWRTFEIVGCIVLLTFVTFLMLRTQICHAVEDTFARAMESDVQAFLDGKTDTYRGFDYAGIRY